MTARLLLILLLATAGPCGYQTAGGGKALPSHIKTIAVQTFPNDSVRYKVDQRFTSAVTSEILRRTSRFKLVSDQHSQLLLPLGSLGQQQPHARL